MKKSIASIGLAASLLGGGVVGATLMTPTLAGAQDDAVEEAPTSDWVRDALDPLVTESVITADQADAVAETLAEARPDHAFGRGFRFGGRIGLDSAADVIGIDTDTLLDSLMDGQSLAEIAEANGSSAQAVIDALVADAQARLDDAVADGLIDPETAEEHSADIAERIEALVNGDVQSFGGRFGRPGPGRFGGGFGGPLGPDADAGTDEEPAGA